MIYLSGKLIEKNEYSNAVSNLLEALEKSNTSFRFVHNTKDIFMPVFGCEMDKKAVNMAKNIFSKSIISVNIRGIAEDGGGLNCISWEM